DMKSVCVRESSLLCVVCVCVCVCVCVGCVCCVLAHRPADELAHDSFTTQRNPASLFQQSPRRLVAMGGGSFMDGCRFERQMGGAMCVYVCVCVCVCVCFLISRLC